MPHIRIPPDYCTVDKYTLYYKYYPRYSPVPVQYGWICPKCGKVVR